MLISLKETDVLLLNSVTLDMISYGNWFLLKLLTTPISCSGLPPSNLFDSARDRERQNSVFPYCEPQFHTLILLICNVHCLLIELLINPTR